MEMYNQTKDSRKWYESHMDNLKKIPLADTKQLFNNLQSAIGFLRSTGYEGVAFDIELDKLFEIVVDRFDRERKVIVDKAGKPAPGLAVAVELNKEPEVKKLEVGVCKK